jgi:hypothetical protein
MAISLESPNCGVNKAAPNPPARPAGCGADAANGHAAPLFLAPSGGAKKCGALKTGYRNPGRMAGNRIQVAKKAFHSSGFAIQNVKFSFRTSRFAIREGCAALPTSSKKLPGRSAGSD